MLIVWNGISPISSIPAISILASQRKMIPRSVELTSFGYKARRSGVSSGQPSVANGQSADENHVSSTSVERTSSLEPHSPHTSGSISVTVAWPPGHSHSGSWCPHQIWREMFQSGELSSEAIANRCCDSGWKRTRPERSASRAGCFSSSIEHHHCSEISGSILVLHLSQTATVCRC